MTPLRKRSRSSRPPAPRTPLPELRQEATLTLPDERRRGARVTESSAEEILLALVVDADRELAVGSVGRMLLEYAAPRGLVRLEGRGSIESPELVRFRVGEALDVVQRRDFVRVAVARPMAIVRLLGDKPYGQWIETLTSNVSGNGLLVAGPDTLQIDDPVRFRVLLEEGQPPLEGDGRVTRITDAGHRGIAIEALPEEQHERLVRFVFERQRIARAMTRDGER